MAGSPDNNSNARLWTARLTALLGKMHSGGDSSAAQMQSNLKAAIERTRQAAIESERDILIHEGVARTMSAELRKQLHIVHQRKKMETARLGKITNPKSIKALVSAKEIAHPYNLALIHNDNLQSWVSLALFRTTDPSAVIWPHPLSVMWAGEILRDLRTLEKRSTGCWQMLSILAVVLLIPFGIAGAIGAVRDAPTGFIWLLVTVALLFVALAREARPPAPETETILGVIADWIAFEQRQRTFWLELSPREFEIETAKLLEQDGFNAKVTQYSQDGGLDIVATRDNVKLAVQCKHYQTSKVAPKEIRALAGSMQIEGATTGLMVCSGGFTKGAVTEAAALKIALWDMEEVLLRANRKA
jgi:hypothetical protein